MYSIIFNITDIGMFWNTQQKQREKTERETGRTERENGEEEQRGKKRGGT